MFNLSLRKSKKLKHAELVVKRYELFLDEHNEAGIIPSSLIMPNIDRHFTAKHSALTTQHHMLYWGQGRKESWKETFHGKKESLVCWESIWEPYPPSIWIFGRVTRASREK